MDVEEDEVESSKLLQQLSSMQTLDKDDLIDQVRRLVGLEAISKEAATFYLEMARWNVASAVGAYFDLAADSMSPTPCMVIRNDESDGHNGVSRVQADALFSRKFVVVNNGNGGWPEGCSVVFAAGTNLAADQDAARMPVSSLAPFQSDAIELRLRAPNTPGLYESKWRLCTRSGVFFGAELWVMVEVEESDTMAITQGMHDLNHSACDQRGERERRSEGATMDEDEAMATS